MFKKQIFPILIILTLFIIAGCLYSQVPELVPTHWNAAGEVDAYSSRFIGLFLVPIVTLAIYLLFLLLPKIAVFKKNFVGFYPYYFAIIMAFVLFMTALYIVSLIQIYRSFSMNLFMIPAMAALFFFLGTIMPKLKRNFFIGIRTPWTLANNQVWEKTHRLGGITFRLNALLMLLTLIWPQHFVIIFVIPLLINLIFLFVYSFVAFRKSKQPGMEAGG